MLKQEKVDFVKDLSQKIKDSTSLVIVNSNGLGVAAQQDLKKKLKESNAKFVVVKNTLLKRALEEAKYPEAITSSEILSGPTAVVIAQDDPISPVQILGKFSSEANTAGFKAGYVDGSFQTADGLTKISKLPGKQALYGQLVGSLYGLPASLVYTLNAPAVMLVTLLKNRIDSLGQNAQG